MGQPKFFVVARKGFGPEQSIPAHLTSNARVRAAYGFDDHPREAASLQPSRRPSTVAVLGPSHETPAHVGLQPSRRPSTVAVGP